jgi:hypothetical protein
MTNEVIAEGPPPLTRQAAEASIDLIDFMAAVVRGVDLIDVTPDVRQRWLAHLTTYYPMLTPMDRYWFATADTTLANLQANWDQAPAEQREMARQSWAQPTAAVLQFASPVIGTTSAPGANPFSAAIPAPAHSSPGPNALASSSPMNDLMGRILAEQKATEDEAFRMGGEQLRQQVELGNQATNIQTLTNIAQMRHEAMMAVAKNLKY